MKYFVNSFNPHEYRDIANLNGNDDVTLMLHSETNRLIVRKKISAFNRQLYERLVDIRNDNLVQIFGIEATEDYFYTYEEYIDGMTLGEIPKPVSEEEARNWIGQLCHAVKVLHEQQPAIIHRDIKPGNVMLTKGGVIKLIDFDAAKGVAANKQRDTELMGTPDYAAPEQYGFAPSDPRTDIFAIGVLFHELLTGYKPNESPARYKGRYKSIILNCTELDPDRRYKSIADLERQLGLRGVGRLFGIIPGFRTGIWWKKVIATVFYLAGVISAISTVYEDPTLLLLGCLVSLFVPPYLLITNPLRLRSKLPLIRSRHIPLKITGITLYLLIWILLFLIVLASYGN